MRIVLAGGGTGGHLFPLIAVAQEMRKIATEKKIVNLQFMYIGADVAGKKIFDSEQIDFKFISAGKLRRYASAATFTDLFKIPIGIIQAFFALLSFYPDVIYSKGGFGAFPVVVAGWVLRIPILIHESDSVPGLSNRFSARYARRIAVSFPQTVNMFPVKKTAYVGNPVRLELAYGSKDDAKETFELVGGRPVLLVLGGSQGSEAINDAFLKMLNHLLKKYEIIHQCGTKNLETVTGEARAVLSTDEQKFYHPVGFINEKHYADAFAACDLVVSRAGASSIFEIALVGKPSILIPLPTSASDHQRVNAYEFARSGAAVIIEQANFVPGIIETKIDNILLDKAVYAKMSAAAHEFSKPQAAAVIAEELLKLANAI